MLFSKLSDRQEATKTLRTQAFQRSEEGFSFVQQRFLKQIGFSLVTLLFEMLLGGLKNIFSRSDSANTLLTQARTLLFDPIYNRMAVLL